MAHPLKARAAYPGYQNYLSTKFFPQSIAVSLTTFQPDCCFDRT